MSDSAQVAEAVARRCAVLLQHLDEWQRRLLLGTEAAGLGRGGIKVVAEATGAHPDTVARGVREIEGQPEPARRVRAPGLYRWGDGGAHFHVWFMPRPLGMLEASGAFLPIWEDVLPNVPDEQAVAAAHRVAAALAADG